MVKESLKEVKDQNYDLSLQPLVSVVMIAYNVEKYLVEAIESVLCQKTNFKVELVIGEDCSTDNTRALALQYKNKYPNTIRVLLPEKNQGLTPNCIKTHEACIGKYIALLDGDDYWTDSMKLQTQIDFLEANPAYSGCAHQALKINDLDPGDKRLFGDTEDKDYDLNDTISHRKFHTSSLVYKKEIWDKVNGIPFGISSNERAIYPMIAIFGKIHYFAQSMCVYRLSGFGLSSRIDYKELETDLLMIPWLKNISPDFPARRFKSFLHLCIYTYTVKKIPTLILLKHYSLFFLNSFSYFPKNLGNLKWGTIFFFKRVV